MMTNRFHTSELLKSASNYPISKGDLPGHEFHGNQWTAGHAGSRPDLPSKPTPGMSISLHHIFGGSAYHFVATSASPSGHKFTARMVRTAGERAGIEKQLAAAKSLEERAQIVKDNPQYFADEETFTRKPDGSYQQKGATGTWRGTVRLNSDTSIPYMD